MVKSSSKQKFQSYRSFVKQKANITASQKYFAFASVWFAAFLWTVLVVPNLAFISTARGSTVSSRSVFVVASSERQFADEMNSSATRTAPNIRNPNTHSVKAFKFEVIGKVQGVFFRKCTQKTAKALGLVGWVMNTDQGTVIGEAQGEATKISEFERWLRTRGSPKSRIDALQVTDRQDLTRPTMTDFLIRRGGED